VPWTRPWGRAVLSSANAVDVQICTEPSPHLRRTLATALYARGVSHKSRVLVVEDERTIAQAIAARLEAEGFAVDQVHDGLAALERAAVWKPELVVLDVMLPGLNGHEVCRRLQADRPVPVLMLTARDDETDILVGLGIGADDYMTKPFSMRELVARIRALLRRVERARSAANAAPDVNVDVNGLRIDGASRRVWSDADEVHLTPTEFDLLSCLAEKPGTVLSRETLLAEVWGWADASATRTVDSHVKSLRRKLGADLVRTVRGVGYALEVGDAPEQGS
jgi:DNA-binding response OmpR family regulator